MFFDIDKKSMLLAGSRFCFLSTVSALVAVISYFFLPEAQRMHLFGHEYLISIVKSSVPLTIHLGSLFMLSLFMVGVVIAFYALCRKENSGPVAWFSLLSIGGFMLGAFVLGTSIIYLPKIALQYIHASDSIKETILILGQHPMGHIWITWLLPGTWFIAVSLIAVTNKMIPKKLLYLGISIGVIFVIAFVGEVTGMITLSKVALAIIMPLFPIWAILEGLYLHNLYLTHCND